MVALRDQPSSISLACVLLAFGTYLASPLVNTRNVDSGDELDCRRCVWVFGSTMDVDAVDAILVCALPNVSNFTWSP